MICCLLHKPFNRNEAQHFHIFSFPYISFYNQITGLVLLDEKHTENDVDVKEKKGKSCELHEFLTTRKKWREEKREHLNCPLIFFSFASILFAIKNETAWHVESLLTRNNVFKYLSLVSILKHQHRLIEFLLNFKASSTSDLTMTHNVSDAPDPIDIKRKLLNVSIKAQRFLKRKMWWLWNRLSWVSLLYILAFELIKEKVMENKSGRNKIFF